MKCDKCDRPAHWQYEGVRINGRPYQLCVEHSKEFDRVLRGGRRKGPQRGEAAGKGGAMKLTGLFEESCKNARNEARRKAKRARDAYDLLKNKRTPYAMEMCALAAVHDRAAFVYAESLEEGLRNIGRDIGEEL